MNYKIILYFNNFLYLNFSKYILNFFSKGELGLGDGELVIGDWGLGPIPNPQSPIPNPQSPIPNINFTKLYLPINSK